MSVRMCPKCGMPTIADARFCRACGQPLSEEAANAVTGPVPQTQAPTVALDQTKVDTDGLDRNLPAPDNFKTVIDRPAPPANYETVIDRPSYPPPPEKPFDPNATQIEATSTQYFQQASEARPDSSPNDAAPTSMLRGQPTVNLAAMVAEDQKQARADQEDDEATVVPGETRTFIPPPSSTSSPPNDETASTSGDLTAPDFSNSDSAAQAPPAPLRTLPVPPRMVVPNTTSTYTAPVSPATEAAAGAAGGQRKGGFKAWHFAVIAGVLVIGLGVLVAGALFARRAGWLSSIGGTTAAPTPAASATVRPTKSAAELLAEAETLTAAGDNDAALTLLREAARLDPANHDAQRRLGDALIKAGARGEAITAYNLAVAADDKDAAAWGALAAAQFDEGLYTESVESYRRLTSLSAGPPAEVVQLALADSLRAAGQYDEAKTSYEKLALSSSEETASAARQRLTELAQIQASGVPTPAPDPTRQALRNRTLTPSPAPTAAVAVVVAQPTTPPPTVPPTPAPPPTRAATVADRYQRGVDLWGSNRGAAVREFLAAQSVSDSNYYLGLNIAEGRDPASLGRAELVAAMVYFQRGQSGPHAAQARRYADALGREYDRRQKGK